MQRNKATKIDGKAGQPAPASKQQRLEPPKDDPGLHVLEQAGGNTLLSAAAADRVEAKPAVTNERPKEAATTNEGALADFMAAPPAT